jgi:hypothetical protein
MNKNLFGKIFFLTDYLNGENNLVEYALEINENYSMKKFKRIYFEIHLLKKLFLFVDDHVLKQQYVLH